MNKKQKGIVFSTLIKLYVVVYIVIFVVGIVKLCCGYRPEQCFWDLLLIFLMPVIGYFFLCSCRKVYFPKKIAGLPVRPQRTRRALNGRIKAYILDSLQYAIAVVVLIFAMDIWGARSKGDLGNIESSQWMEFFGKTLLEFLIFFVMSFAIDYVIYEVIAKKYVAQLRRRAKRKKEYKEIMEAKSDNDGE